MYSDKGALYQTAGRTGVNITRSLVNSDIVKLWFSEIGVKLKALRCFDVDFD